MKYLFLIFIITTGLFFNAFSQVRKLPASIDTATIRIEDIPSPEKLKELGATDEEIKQIMDFKARKLAEQGKTETVQKPVIADTPKEKAEAPAVLPLPELPPSNIFGQEFFRNNNIRFFDKATDMKAPEHYILGVGDQVNVSVWGFSDYNEVFTVDKDGFINPRETGRIYLRGLKLSDARELISKKFGSFLDLINSKIDITLVYSRVITVNIVGEVFNPGSYTIPAINTAFNALIAVRGPNPIGSVRKIFVKRNGENIRTLDVYQFLLNPDSKEDFFLENNDYIFIPPAERVVKISGEVKRAHHYELTEKENLHTLIKYAGGLPPTASTKTIQIKRYRNNEVFLIDVNLDSLLLSKKDFELSNGDEVIVRKIKDAIENKVVVKGAVRIPGEYEIKLGDRLSDLIARAKGLTFDAYIEKAYVVRLNEDFSKSYLTLNLRNALENKASADNLLLQRFDEIQVITKLEFQEEYSISVYGAVRNPGKFLYGDGLTLKDVLYMAGGLKKEAALNRIDISRTMLLDKESNRVKAVAVQLITLEIGPDLSQDKISEEFKLQPYDQIKVREEPDYDLQENILIEGEVRYPGIYTIKNKKEKLLDLINRAGGMTEWAFPEAAKIYRKQENAGYLVLDLKKVLNDPDSKFNYVLKEGDNIRIPRVNDLVQIKGAIDYPDIQQIIRINAPYYSGNRAGFYIRNYGLGFSKYAWKKKTYVEQPGGKIDRTKKIFFVRIYPKVKQGAIIYVPVEEAKREKDKEAKEPIDWNKFIENTTVKLTGVLTLWLLIDRLK